MEAVRAKIGLRIPLVVFFLLIGHSVSGQVADVPNIGELQGRVNGFYDALENRKFETVWAYYLNPAMKRDTPKDEYVKILQKTFGTPEVICGFSEVWIEKTGTGQWQGRAVTPITMVTGEGEFIRADHKTIWVRQQITKGKVNWLLAGDEMKVNWLLPGDEMKE